MSSRRTFLALAAAGLANAAARTFSRPLGLQLYSLRREAAKDLPGTLELVRELGFTELEVGDFFGRTASEFRSLLSAHGMKATSMGAGWGQLAKSIEQAAANARVRA